MATSERSRIPHPSLRFFLALTGACASAWLRPLIERPSTIVSIASQVLALCLVGGMLTAVVLVFLDLHRNRLQGLLDGALLACALVAIPPVARSAMTWRFEQVRPQLDSVVSDLEQAEAPAVSELAPVVDAATNGTVTYAVLASRGEVIGLTVEFLTGGGFPVKHSGYLFEAGGVMTEESRQRWPTNTRLGEHWFRISD